MKQIQDYGLIFDIFKELNQSVKYSKYNTLRGDERTLYYYIFINNQS